MNDIYASIFSESPREWRDLKEILKILRNYGLTESEAVSVLYFLAKYFFELDSSGKRVRPLSSFRRLYEKE